MKESIGKRFYYIRLLHGYTQEYVARRVSISVTSYIDLEAGRAKNIPVQRLLDVLVVYGLTLEQFFAFTPDDLLKLVKGENKIMEEKHLREMIHRIEGMYHLLYQLVDKLSTGRIGDRGFKT